MVGGRTYINRTMEGICEGLAGLLRQAGHMIAELGEGTPPSSLTLHTPCLPCVSKMPYVSYAKTGCWSFENQSP